MRVRPPADTTNARILLLIHGLTGDEHSMWVFSRRFPEQYCIIAPRAPMAYAQGGYTWVDAGLPERPGIDQFTPAVPRLLTELAGWLDDFKLPPQPMDLIGFSQGAAMVYSILLTQPWQVNRMAALCGFLPAGAEKYIPPGSLNGKKIFVSHGVNDPVIPVEEARKAVPVLQRGGAEVSYCEEDTGHKLSVQCTHGLEDFFEL
ncbi:MAG: hypothetical protein VB089_00090 [Anaerolineaceae bacterium]|nr:hypothetical protein [Anaerolineaceae bacterium]